MYKELYSKTDADKIEGDRKTGITKDCLAIIYKIACAYFIPYCKNGQENPGVCKNYCDLMKYRCACVDYTLHSPKLNTS
jgi:hypothetical protein